MIGLKAISDKVILSLLIYVVCLVGHPLFHLGGAGDLFL